MTTQWLRRVVYGVLVLFLATIWLVGLIGADDPPYSVPERVGRPARCICPANPAITQNRSH